MSNDELEINNQINLNNNLQDVTYESQKNFLQTSLGQVINGGINIGLRAILPDVIEDELIEIKDSIITNGFQEGIKTAVNNAIDLGKSVLGIFTGNFENMSQVKDVIKKGGLLDSISDILDWGINKAKEKDLIDSSTASLIKKGKNTILNTVNNNIENNMTSQIESIEKVDKYIEKWNEYYKNQDFTNMEKQYNKMEKELQVIMPIQNVLTKAKIVENLHNLIKNNGKNFNISSEEIELANKLI